MPSTLSVNGSFEFEEVRCDLCGKADCDEIFVKEGFRHVRCKSCRLVYVNPRLLDHLEHQCVSGTGGMDADQLTPAQKRRLRRAVKAVEPFRKLNSLLEVGPGKGWFLSEAKDMDWNTCAVEINRDALPALQAKGIDRIEVEPAETFALEDESFDVVRMWDVIEHLRSPRKALWNIARVLRPNGLLRLATTNFASLSRVVNGPEWIYLNGSDHIFLFEPKTISRLLTECGFKEISIRTGSFNLKRKLYYPEKKLPASPTILRPFRKIIDSVIRFTPYGHQMIVTAYKGTGGSHPPPHICHD